MFDRMNLGSAALILGAYGIVLFLYPSVLAGWVGLEFVSPNAPVEIRSFYGGLELGIAAFLAACARKPALVPAGLLFCALAFSFAGAARLLGVVQFGHAGATQPVVGVIELIFASVCGWSYFGRPHIA